ncbi:hypothetical protein MSKU3_0194 [Komagataeibacter oboediens]|nr:hypothetical protein MSKU3_0194 [Komagataeibacter oboediens]
MPDMGPRRQAVGCVCCHAARTGRASAPARFLPAKLVPMTVNTSLPIRPSGSAFMSLDEHDLAVRRASSSAGYIATTIIAMPGFLTLTAQAVLDIRLLHDVGYGVAALLLFGYIVMVNFRTFAGPHNAGQPL